MSTEPDTKQRKAEMRKSLKATLKASSADDMASQSSAGAVRLAAFWL